MASGGFDDFYLDHYVGQVRSLRFATGNAAEAEDAAQEAFVKALVKWSTVSAVVRPATWVYVVALRELRRREALEASAERSASDFSHELWGAATDAGPFAGLQNASPGDTVILRQVAPTECMQRWRITQVVTSQDALTSSRPVLRLVGFAPNATGPVTQFYVEAVPG